MTTDATAELGAPERPAHLDAEEVRERCLQIARLALHRAAEVLDRAGGPWEATPDEAYEAFDLILLALQELEPPRFPEGTGGRGY